MMKITDWNAVQPDGSTILTKAAQWGLCPLIEELLTDYRDKVSVDAQDGSGATALLRACEHAQPQAVATLLKFGASPRIPNKWLQSPLFFAVSTFNMLPTGGVSLNAAHLGLATDGLVGSPSSLHMVPSLSTTSAGTLQMNMSTIGSSHQSNEDETGLLANVFDFAQAAEYPITALILARADVNSATATGVTPLMKAISDNCALPVVQALIAAKAIVNVQNSSGDSPLGLAVERDRPDIVELLVASRAQLQILDSQGYTPLAKAVLKDHVRIAQTLLRARADVNCRALNGATPLILAADAGGRSAMIDVLLDPRTGIDVNARDHKGETALFKAITHDDYEIAQMLVDNGASLYSDPAGSELDEALMNLMDDSGVDILLYGPSAPRIPIPREIYEIRLGTPSALAFRLSPAYKPLQARGIDGEALAYLWVQETAPLAAALSKRNTDPAVIARRAEARRLRTQRQAQSEAMRRVLQSSSLIDVNKALSAADTKSTPPFGPMDPASTNSADGTMPAGGPPPAPIRITAGIRATRAGFGASTTANRKAGELLGLPNTDTDANGRVSFSDMSVPRDSASDLRPNSTYGYEFTDYDAVSTSGGTFMGPTTLASTLDNSNQGSTRSLSSAQPSHPLPPQPPSLLESKSSVPVTNTSTSSMPPVGVLQKLPSTTSVIGANASTPLAIPSFLKYKANTTGPRHGHAPSISVAPEDAKAVTTPIVSAGGTPPSQIRQVSVATEAGTPPRPPRHRQPSLSKAATEAAMLAIARLPSVREFASDPENSGTAANNDKPPIAANPPPLTLASSTTLPTSTPSTVNRKLPQLELPQTPPTGFQRKSDPVAGAAAAAAAAATSTPSASGPLPLVTSRSDTGGASVSQSIGTPTVPAPSIPLPQPQVSSPSNPQSQPQPQHQPVHETRAMPSVPPATLVRPESAEQQQLQDPDLPVLPPPPGPSQDPRLWRRAVDSNTSMPYYYNVRTKEAIWQIPMCVQAIDRCAECSCEKLQMDPKKIAFCVACQHWHS